ncbi:hypothetical protein TetV_441 [Tetraselmis virus 1]|uniref:Uncharacterized protein n=1 Tax=Tetraselmis virus 1 TaxID=2060617 RepID=A0A2P0VNP7_9VIRU|nr:hypothetical protein QJ968_gp613 [Tetraselmis virus 1]AUF82523.1 hypothetical protein TetV_441 [Tetraselmis virus 1]
MNNKIRACEKELSYLKKEIYKLKTISQCQEKVLQMITYKNTIDLVYSIMASIDINCYSVVNDQQHNDPYLDLCVVTIFHLLEKSKTCDIYTSILCSQCVDIIVDDISSILVAYSISKIRAFKEDKELGDLEYSDNHVNLTI